MKLKLFKVVAFLILLLVVTANAAPKPKLRLSFEAGKVKNKIALDISGSKNAGVLRGGVRVFECLDGKKVFQFNGMGQISVKKSESIDPSLKAITVEVVAKIEPESNGILVAFGGNVLGYALAVQNGCAMFAVRSGKTLVMVKTAKPLSGWIKLTGIITADQQVELLINGRSVGKRAGSFISKIPVDSMQIGADIGSQVIEPVICNFAGLLESVKIYSGDKR